jgi:hypothetical protein
MACAGCERRKEAIKAAGQKAVDVVSALSLDAAQRWEEAKAAILAKRQRLLERLGK